MSELEFARLVLMKSIADDASGNVCAVSTTGGQTFVGKMHVIGQVAQSTVVTVDAFGGGTVRIPLHNVVAIQSKGKL